MEEVSMLNNIEFDLWADGYDKTVGISDEGMDSRAWISGYASEENLPTGERAWIINLDRELR